MIVQDIIISYLDYYISLLPFSLFPHFAITVSSQNSTKSDFSSKDKANYMTPWLLILQANSLFFITVETTQDDPV